MILDQSDSFSEDGRVFEDSKTLNFIDFNLNNNLLKGVQTVGFKDPSPIQEQAIPMVLAGSDLIGQAQTGSGKTAAFVIPAIEKLKYDKSVEVLVLVPTRELCKQVVKEFERIAKFTKTRVVGVVGGESGYRQIELINRGAQVVVATPGRILDHLSSGRLKKFVPQLVVLDEADEMLDMGFIDDIRKILAYTPQNRQTLLFSATMPDAIARLAKDELKKPEHIRLTSKAAQHNDIEQLLYLIRPRERDAALIRLIDAEKPHKAVVFCRTRRDTTDVCENLVRSGIRALALHGDLSQNERTRAIREIKDGHAKVLVATDVASRGLDIPDLTHVFNYQVPENHERYTHRIGRTGRAGKKGKSITLATQQDVGGNYYLRNSTKQDSKINLAEIPSLASVREEKNRDFFEDISSLSISKEAQKACESFVDHESSYEFLQKLYTYVMKKHQVKGPDLIGFSVGESERMLLNSRSSSSSRNGFRSRRGGGGNGRGYSSRSSGGGRYSSPSRANSGKPPIFTKKKSRS